MIQSFISKARSLAIEDNNGNDIETRRCNPLLLEIRDWMLRAEAELYFVKEAVMQFADVWKWFSGHDNNVNACECF